MGVRGEVRGGESVERRRVENEWPLLDDRANKGSCRDSELSSGASLGVVRWQGRRRCKVPSDLAGSARESRARPSPPRRRQVLEVQVRLTAEWDGWVSLGRVLKGGWVWVSVGEWATEGGGMTSSRFAGSFVCLLTPISRRRRTPLASPSTSTELMADSVLATLTPEEKADRIADCLGLRDGSYVELVPAFVSYAGSVDHLTVEHGFGYQGLPLAFNRVVGHRKPSTSQAGSLRCQRSSPQPVPSSVPAPPGPESQ